MKAGARGRRQSLPRLAWAAIMRQGFPLLAVFLPIFLLQFWFIWRHQPHDLVALAAGARWPVFWLGASTMIASLYSTWAQQRWFVDELRRNLQPELSPFGLREPAPQLASLAVGPTPPDPMLVALPVLIGLGAACLGFAVGLHVIVTLSPDPPSGERGWQILPMYVAVAILLGAAVSHVTTSTRRLYVWCQETAAAAATAQADAARARIAALQAQLDPHFLFNALNTVASLLGSDGARARNTVRNLSRMLEHTLQRSARPLTTVADEVQFVRDYLDIQRERFGPRLTVTYDIASDADALLVPTMSLQPLVENAIKYAVASRLEGGRIRIAASTLIPRRAVRLSVEDDGPGFAPDSPDGTGLGNLRARLRSLYGPPPEAELITDTLPTGARVSLIVPIADPS